MDDNIPSSNIPQDYTVWDAAKKSILFTEPAGFTGQGALWFTNTPPNGWLICDGSTPLIKDYPRLFKLWGTTFGGNGTTTFGLPDLRTRVPVGRSAGDADFGTLGGSGGAKTVDSSHAHMVPSVMGANSGALQPIRPDSFSGSVLQGVATLTVGATIGAFAGNTEFWKLRSDTGGNSALPNIQPYLTINYIVKA